MENMIVFAIEKHWDNHVGIPSMSYMGSTKLEDGSGFVRHYQCQGCGDVVDVTEPIRIRNNDNDI